jgi:hypothetical protein
MFDPDKVKNIDFSNLDPERISKILKMVKSIDQKTIDYIYSEINSIIQYEDKKEDLIRQIELILKVCLIVYGALI